MSNDLEANMNRKQKRIVLNQPIEINDVINGGKFGELINISTEGLMVMTKCFIPTQAIYQLSINLPASLQGKESLDLGADCLWCHREEHSIHYWAGLQIIDASDTAMYQIRELIAHYKNS